MKNEYSNIVKSILENGTIEGIKIENLNLLKDVMNDEEINDLLYKNYENNFPIDSNDTIMKTQDLVYRVNYCINNCLLKRYNPNDYVEIKSSIKNLIIKDADFYSAVSYDDFDKEMIEEFDFLLDGKDINM